jgi:uroporphyrinogen-III synthase
MAAEIENPARGFAGLGVLSLESRRAAEMAKLIANNGGRAVVAPSMPEVPIESNREAQEFARTIRHGGFDGVIFLTGVGTRALVRVVETVYAVAEFVAALQQIPVLARGPKPVAALRELGIPITLAAPEPNTWREVLRVLDDNENKFPLTGRRIAVQEYGMPNPELLAGLAERGALVTNVPVYEWALPEDTGPLRAAVTAISRSEFDVALFTTAMQVTHLFQIAAEMNLVEAVRLAFKTILIASIGPVTTERLKEFGLRADLEPSHPKMGYLVGETAQRSAEILQDKRRVAH